ncbi:MAG: c-type cytochrome [Thermodesulfobacteriota bacterium]
MKQAAFLAVFAAVVLLGVYLVITVYDANLKVGRMEETPVVRPHEEPPLKMDPNAVSFRQNERLIKENLSESLPGGPIKPTQEILEKGKADYMAFCSHCHGRQLSGQGTVGQSFQPLPTDLTGKKAVELTDRELFAVISYGGKKSPALASTMSVKSRRAVIAYLRAEQEAKKD